MADREFSIKFNTNIGEVAKKQEDLNRKFSQHLNMLNDIVGLNNSQLGFLVRQKEAWEKVSQEVDLTSEQLEKVNENISGLDENIRRIEDPFEEMLDSMIPFGSLLISQNRKIDRLVQSLSKVKAAGGFFNLLTDYMDRFGKKLSLFRQLSGEVFGRGLVGVLGTMRVGFAKLLPIISGLVATMSPLLPLIAGIGVAIFTLQRMWKNNVGGMQTLWYRFIGTARDTWHRFVVSFDRLLRTLSPLFKILFTAVFKPLTGALKLISILLDGINIILKPIFDALNEIGKALIEPFEAFGSKQGKSAINIFGLIGKAVNLVAKALAFLVRISLKPIIIPFKILGTILKFVFKLLVSMKDAVVELFNVFKNLLFPFKFVLGASEKIAKWLGLSKEESQQQLEVQKQIKNVQSQVTMTQTYNQQRTVVNNNPNVVIQTSAPITPETAPQVGNILASKLTTGAKVV